jgi:carboxymethylenebutenolidase
MKLVVLLLAVLTTLCAPAFAQDWAEERLNKSPRHLDWVNVKNGKRNVKCFIAYPERKDKAPVVVLIHEIFGLSEWVRSVADQLAERGYIAIAPDLLSGVGPGGGGTCEMIGEDKTRKAVTSLPPAQVTADLNAVSLYAVQLPACNGKLAVAGFCWGGGQAFRYATNNKQLKAAFVFYGQGPESAAEADKISAPVYGFYAENDARINAGLDKTMMLMKTAGKSFEPVIYAGAGHGFMRAGEAPDANDANKTAREKAWKRWDELMKKI